MIVENIIKLFFFLSSRDKYITLTHCLKITYTPCFIWLPPIIFICIVNCDFLTWIKVIEFHFQHTCKVGAKINHCDCIIQLLN